MRKKLREERREDQRLLEMIDYNSYEWFRLTKEQKKLCKLRMDRIYKEGLIEDLKKLKEEIKGIKEELKKLKAKV